MDDNVIFIGEENDFGQVMTTLWVKSEALSPKCKYFKSEEKNISITINSNIRTDTKTRVSRLATQGEKESIFSESENVFFERHLPTKICKILLIFSYFKSTILRSCKMYFSDTVSFILICGPIFWEEATKFLL